MLFFPTRYRRVQRHQHILDLLTSRYAKAASVLAIKLNRFVRGMHHLGDFTARICPKILTLDQNRGLVRLHYTFFACRVVRISHMTPFLLLVRWQLIINLHLIGPYSSDRVPGKLSFDFSHALG